MPDPSLTLLLAQEAVAATWTEDSYVHKNASIALFDALAYEPGHDGPVSTILLVTGP